MTLEMICGLTASYLPPCGGGRRAKRGGRGVNFRPLSLPLTPLPNPPPQGGREQTEQAA